MTDRDKALEATLERVLELLPEWAIKDRTITLLADQELIASWNIHEGLKIKKVRCNLCAECCLDMPENYLPFGTNGEGRCNMLSDEGKCTAGHNRPFACLGDPSDPDLECCIRYM
jgi:hypothetical protein